MIALERLAVLFIFNNRFLSSLVNEVNFFTPELVLRSFIVCLDMEGAHGDLWGEDDLRPIHQEESHLFGGPTGWCPITPQCAWKLINPLLAMLL
jgi:hypothetical protein